VAWKNFVDGPVLSKDDLNLLMRQGIPAFASTTERAASVPAPYAGQLCYVTGLGLQQYSQVQGAASGSYAWRALFADVTYAKFQAADTTQAIPSATWRRVKMTNVLAPHTSLSPGWTVQVAADGGSTYLCTVPGRYAITGFFRFNQGTAGHRALGLADGSSQATNNIAYAGHLISGTDYWAATVHGERTFLANDTLAMWVWQTTNPAVALTAFGDMGNPHLTISRMFGV
jgi:hypothetical protein